MWNARGLLSLALLLSLFIPRQVAATQQIEKETVWQGEVVLNAAVVVKREAVLTILAGTTISPQKPEYGITVQGTIKVLGTKKAPVKVTPVASWKGIEMIGAGKENEFLFLEISQAKAALSSIATPFTVRHSIFRDCEVAVKLLRDAYPVIEENLFEKNGIGIDNEMKSFPVIRGNTFRGHSKNGILAAHNSGGPIEKNIFEHNTQGITLIQKYPDKVTENRFSDNIVGIYCNQTQNSPIIRDNLFEGNENALVNLSFAYPQVDNNRFLDNETAIRNDQYGSPQVVRNLIRGSKMALYNNRKSNPKVEANRIENNRLIFFCDYSSYPKVRNNNFIGNRKGVELGIYQSADWERRSGSKSIVMEQATARRSQNPLLAKAPTQFEDFVDVSGNWWGEDTKKLISAGEGGNSDLFDDRLDTPTVTYEGFGPESYVLDWVKFSPWLDKPVADVGPEKR